MPQPNSTQNWQPPGGASKATPGLTVKMLLDIDAAVARNRETGYRSPVEHVRTEIQTLEQQHPWLAFSQTTPKHLQSVRDQWAQLRNKYNAVKPSWMEKLAATALMPVVVPFMMGKDLLVDWPKRLKKSMQSAHPEYDPLAMFEHATMGMVGGAPGGLPPGTTGAGTVVRTLPLLEEILGKQNTSKIWGRLKYGSYAQQSRRGAAKAPAQARKGIKVDPLEVNFVRTTSETANKMVQLALAGERQLGKTLEPSAGEGHILERLLPHTNDALAIELHPQRAAMLQQNFQADVLNTSFLHFWEDTGFDTILMNPPWGPETQWALHLTHAYSQLRPGGRLVAALPWHVDPRYAKGTVRHMTNWMEGKLLERSSLPPVTTFVEGRVQFHGGGVNPGRLVVLDKPLTAAPPSKLGVNAALQAQATERGLGAFTRATAPRPGPTHLGRLNTVLYRQLGITFKGHSKRGFHWDFPASGRTFITKTLDDNAVWEGYGRAIKAKRRALRKESVLKEGDAPTAAGLRALNVRYDGLFFGRHQWTDLKSGDTFTTLTKELKEVKTVHSNVAARRKPGKGVTLRSGDTDTAVIARELGIEYRGTVHPGGGHFAGWHRWRDPQTDDIFLTRTPELDDVTSWLESVREMVGVETPYGPNVVTETDLIDILLNPASDIPPNIKPGYIVDGLAVRYEGKKFGKHRWTDLDTGDQFHSSTLDNINVMHGRSAALTHLSRSWVKGVLDEAGPGPPGITAASDYGFWAVAYRNKVGKPVAVMRGVTGSSTSDPGRVSTMAVDPNSGLAGGRALREVWDKVQEQYGLSLRPDDMMSQAAIKIMDKFGANYPIASTTSKAFARWFGNSKVVDKKGKPLQVYRPYNAVEPLRLSKTPTPTTATEPVYVRIENPLRNVREFVTEHFPGETVENATRRPSFYRIAQMEGYDGAIYGTTVQVFDRTQIKGVYNRGYWGRRDPNISKAGDPASFIMLRSLSQRQPEATH